MTSGSNSTDDGTAYRVEVNGKAYEAILSQARYIAFEQKALLNAKRWLEELWDAVDTLENYPRR